MKPNRALLLASFVLFLAYASSSSAQTPSGYISSDQISGRSLDAADRSVVVLIHGWTGETLDNPSQWNSPPLFRSKYDEYEWRRVVDVLKPRLELATPATKLLLFHWEDDASTGTAIGSSQFDRHDFDAAFDAASNAFLNGTRLAEQLNDASPDLRRVTFVAHSAGAWAAYRAVDRLLHLNPYVVVNMVLLDPFIPSVGLATSLSTSTMSSLANHVSADRIYRLENYFSIDFLTDSDLSWLTGEGGSNATSQIFSWRPRDINGTQIGTLSNQRVDYLAGEVSIYGGHSGPKLFFADTVVAATLGQPVPSALVFAPWDFTTVGFPRGLVAGSVTLPRFTTNPAPISHPTEGTTLDMPTSALRADSYQWFKDGEPLAGQTSSALALHPVSASDAGTYVVRASNDEGVIFSDKMVLSVTAPLRITTIAPGSGPTAGGTSITIHGSGFQPGAAVSIGAIFATNVVVVDSATITASTPPFGAGRATVSVLNPDSQFAQLVDGFLFTDGPIGTAPTITSIAPTTLVAAPCSVRQILTIDGTGFDASTKLVFNYGDGDVPSTATYLRLLSPTRIEYDVAVCTEPDIWTVRAVNGALSSATKSFEVVAAGSRNYAPIVIDGNIPDWDGIAPLITDAVGDGPTDANGQYFPGEDFVSLSVANDSANVYLLLEFAANHSGGIALYLDTDLNSSTGCNGAEYLIFTSGSEPGGHLALSDYRNCGVHNDYPGAVTSLPPHNVGRFLDAAISLDTLRALTPGLSGFKISGFSSSPPPSGISDSTSAGHYDLRRTAVDDHYAVKRGQTLSVAAPGVLANDIFPGDADPRIEFVSFGSGELTNLNNGTGGFTFSPAADFAGTQVLKYVVHTGPTTSNEASVIINVTPPDMLATDDAYVMTEGQSLFIQVPGLLTNDLNLPPAASPELVTFPIHGNFVPLGAGGFQYTPSPNFTGAETFSYQVRSGNVTSNIATVTISVVPLPPLIANDDQYSAVAGTTLSVPDPGALMNDLNVPPAASIEFVAFPQHGNFGHLGSGGFFYSPSSNFSGSETFTYIIRSGTRTSNVATITVAVAPPPPLIANNDSYNATAGVTLSVPTPGLLANDLNLPAASSTQLIAFPQHGSYTNTGNGGFQYTPSASFSGIETFTYVARSGTRTSNAATVTITVAGPPPLIAKDDSYAATAGLPLIVAAPGLLSNDLDIPPGATTQLVVLPQHGSYTNLGAGSFQYTPSASFSGAETFTYIARSGSRASNQATVTITVTPPPDTTPPTISPAAGVTAEASSAAGAVVDYPIPMATDAVDGNVPVSCVPSSGSGFALGVTVVQCSARDLSGNVGASSFGVTVRDTTAPAIAVTAGRTLEAAGPNGAIVVYASPATADAVDGPGVATCSPGSGQTFPVGDTVVTCLARDGAGNTSQSQFSVLVTDLTAPTLVLPADQIAEASGPLGTAVEFSASATDLVDGPRSVICSPASGALFPLGSTTVSCSSSDRRGNSSAGLFRINVRDTRAPSVSGSLVPVGDQTSSGQQPYVVSFAANDAVGVASISATLNGIPVTNGQVVSLKLTKKADKKVKDDGKTLKIDADSIILTVVARDSTGNVGTANASLPDGAN